MSRSYPIGSLLLLAKSPEFPLGSKSIEMEITQDCPDYLESTDQTSKADEKYYILDGQQRITSIARVFLNAYPKQCYYFDLKAMLKSHLDLERKTSWIVSQDVRLSPDRKMNGKRLRGDIILNQEKADIFVSEYIEDSQDFPEYQTGTPEARRSAREAAAKIKGIFETIRNYKVPVVIVEPDSGIESVCRIFETINSTGTKLTTFDLAVARFYPQIDLRELWESMRKKHRILENFDVDGEHVLKIVYLVTASHDESYRYIEPTRGNLMGLKTESINEEWEKASESLAKAYEFAKAQGARPKTLPRDSILVSLAAVRSLMLSERGTDLLDNWKEHDLIRRWYFSNAMQASQSQASNYQIGLDFQALWDYVRDGKQLECPKVTLNTEMILTSSNTPNVIYKALQNILDTTIRKDLISGNAISSESVLDSHHIFPKNSDKKYKLPISMLNSICNRIPVLSHSNRSLGEGYPQDYLKEIVDRARNEGTLGDFSRRVRDCFIPGDPEHPEWLDSFSIDRFEEFCRKRADLIIERVGEIIGSSLQTVSPSSDDEVEDDDD